MSKTGAAVSPGHPVSAKRIPSARGKCEAFGVHRPLTVDKGRRRFRRLFFVHFFGRGMRYNKNRKRMEARIQRQVSIGGTRYGESIAGSVRSSALWGVPGSGVCRSGCAAAMASSGGFHCEWVWGDREPCCQVLVHMNVLYRPVLERLGTAMCRRFGQKGYLFADENGQAWEFPQKGRDGQSSWDC